MENTTESSKLYIEVWSVWQRGCMKLTGPGLGGAADLDSNSTTDGAQLLYGDIHIWVSDH